MAEMGAGAEGWASGSQAWKGMRAALSPKPMMNRAEQAATTHRESVSWSPRATAAKLDVPGDAEEDGDPDEDEGRGDDREHEVLEGRLELVGFEPEGHQGVGGHGRHFEEDVDVEQVGREDQAVHPGDHDQEEGVVIGLGPVVLHVVDGEDARRRGRRGRR